METNMQRKQSWTERKCNRQESKPIKVTRSLSHIAMERFAHFIKMMTVGLVLDSCVNDRWSSKGTETPAVRIAYKNYLYIHEPQRQEKQNMRVNPTLLVTINIQAKRSKIQPRTEWAVDSKRITQPEKSVKWNLHKERNVKRKNYSLPAYLKGN